jgi:DMSO reductase anchor subunit
MLAFATLPALAIALSWLLPDASAPLLLLASLSVMLGAFVERWLFFAEARHVVSLYY